MPQVRISTASFVTIRDESGRFALLINKNLAGKGQSVLTPIGGAIEATAQGIQHLQRLLNIFADSFEKGNDLRFIMPGSVANLYREWFLSGIERETDPSREITEELVTEAGLLIPSELSGLICTLSGYSAELAVTSRTGKEGQTTLRLLEVYSAALPPATLEKLQIASQSPTSLLQFVTAEEITSGFTQKRIEIGSVSKSLLKPEITIPEFK